MGPLSTAWIHRPERGRNDPPIFLRDVVAAERAPVRRVAGPGWRVTLSVAACLNVCGGLANAYTGGPELAEVLGWDPTEGKVFCVIHDRSEGGLPAGLVYLNLDGSRSALPVHIDWSRRHSTPDSVREARWRSIVSRLQPLKLLVAPSIPRDQLVVATDTVEFASGRVPRFRVRMNPSPDIGMEATLEVTTYHRPGVSVPRLYEIPGRRELVAVVAFVGKWYGGEEVQMPVLLRHGGPEVPRIEWKVWDPYDE